MFRLHKTKKPVKSGERIDFKFSQFKALQVPKGWDKLFVSIISVETGKTIAKSSKAAVRNGNCQWTDTVSESILVSKDELSHSSKDLEDCPYKLVLALGSARSGILGEAVMNMATYTSSRDSLPVSFPLIKCNHGTILQFKIQCLTPRLNLREDGSKETNSPKEGLNPESLDEEIKLEESDSTLSTSARSYSSRDLGSTTHQQDDEKKEGEGDGEEAPEEGSYCTSGSHSYDSAESSMEKASFSPDENKLIAGQDSTSSHNSEPPGSSNAEDASKLDDSSCNSHIKHSENLSQDDPQEFAAPSLGISCSSKSLLETAEDTIEDLRGEAKIWERNAKKLMVDLEILRKEYSEQSKNLLNLEMEMSATCAERDGLQKEVEQLKLLLEKPSILKDSMVQDNGINNVIKEMENEIRFLKETNDNLTLQLNRSQESNVELVSVLQELEETVEKQKAEMENVQADAEKNQYLILQVQQLQESENNLLAKVQELEKAFEDKTQNLEEGGLNHQSLLNIEKEYHCKSLDKEKEIAILKEKLSDTLKERQSSAKLESTERGNGSLIREIESLKAKLQELESDCQELTDENLQLLVELKEMKQNSAGGVTSTGSRFEASDQEFQIQELEEKMRKIETDHNLTIQESESQKLELEGKVRELSKELSEKGDVIERLEAGLLSKEEEIDNLKKCRSEVEEKLYALRKEKGKLEENVEIVSRESDIAIKCLNDLQKDIMVLSSSVDTRVSANKVLERKSSELENGKRELEIRVSELEQENEELSACISVIEAQVRNLIDERKSIALELENSKSNTVTIQDEIARLRNEMQSQEIDARQKLEEMNNRWSQAREEVEHLRNANPKLQATAESLMRKCGSLQKSVRELRMQKLELQDHCDKLEMKLRESQRNFADCSQRVNALQENICALVEESAAKERSLTSELDVLVKENELQNKKLVVLNQMHMEKIAQVENLRREVEDLNKQLTVAQDENERIASNAAKEASDLFAKIAKLESELKARQTESKANIEDLMDELASSKQNQEMLKVEMAKMMNLLENYRSSEENFKTTLNGLELKLTVSEYEHQQLMEETIKLKAQLLKTGPLEDEVSALKNEKEKLETSLILKNEECKELKIENKVSIEKLTELQNAVSELEGCRKDKFALEERLEKLESSLLAKEAMCEEDAELKKELSWIKRANKQLQQQIQQLEEGKEKLNTRADSLEEELILMKEKQRNHRDSTSINSPGYQGNKLLEDELYMGSSNAYKVQFKRLASENQKSRTGSPRKSKAEAEFVQKERFERTKSSLDTELTDLRERYFHMSLKYAEVEAQREELMMKLKAANNGKRWF